MTEEELERIQEIAYGEGARYVLEEGWYSEHDFADPAVIRLVAEARHSLGEWRKAAQRLQDKCEEVADAAGAPEERE